MNTKHSPKFEHRIRTIIGHLRTVVKRAESDPADAYGQLHTIERSVQQAKMFVIKDLIDQLYCATSKEARKDAITKLYDCLGFHRDELPDKKPRE